MSVESISAVLRVAGISSTDKLVLIGIANHDGDGGAWPSVATLAVYADCSERTVQRGLERLAELGLITIRLQAGGTRETRADRRPNRYDIHFDRVTQMSPRAERGDTGDVNGVTSTAERGDTATSPEPSKEPSKEPSTSRRTLTHANVEQLFDRFWEQYPRREAKPKAKVKFVKAVHALGTPAPIFIGLDAWGAYWAARNEPEFVPQPARWLHEERWNDTPPPVRAGVRSDAMDVLTRMAGGR